MTDIGRNMAEASDIESSRSSSVYRDIAAASGWRMPGSTTFKKTGGHGARCHDAGHPPGAVTASVAEAAQIMVDQHIHRLVVTQGKEPVGIITSMDVLKMGRRGTGALPDATKDTPSPEPSRVALTCECIDSERVREERREATRVLRRYSDRPRFTHADVAIEVKRTRPASG